MLLLTSLRSLRPGLPRARPLSWDRTTWWPVLLESAGSIRRRLLRSLWPLALRMALRELTSWVYLRSLVMARMRLVTERRMRLLARWLLRT